MAEFITYGGAIRCREVTRSVNAQGILVETWGDFRPLSACGMIARPSPEKRFSVVRDPQDPSGGDLPDFDTVYVGDKEPTPVVDDNLTSFKMSSENKFLLIAAAVVVGLVGLVFVFKK